MFFLALSSSSDEEEEGESSLYETPPFSAVPPTPLEERLGGPPFAAAAPLQPAPPAAEAAAAEREERRAACVAGEGTAAAALVILRSLPPLSPSRSSSPSELEVFEVLICEGALLCDLSEVGWGERGVCEWGEKEEEEEVSPASAKTTTCPCFHQKSLLLLSLALHRALFLPHTLSLSRRSQRTALFFGTPGLVLIALSSESEKER